MGPIIQLLRRYLIAYIQREIAKQRAVQIVSRLLKSIRAEVNIEPGLRLLDKTQRQVKYATAVALTRTAKRLQKLAEEEVAKVFDRPTKFVQQGFYTKPASPANLEAIVGIKDRQAKVLLPHITGGGRDLKPFEQKLATDAKSGAGYWVPGDGIKLNAAGNLTKGQIVQIAQGLQRTGKYADVFVGYPDGHPGAPFGIWGRKIKGRGRNASAGIIPLLVRIKSPSYRQRFDFHGIAEKHAQRIFNEEFDRAFSQAMASAR
jgi:hypothetical protein